MAVLCVSVIVVIVLDTKVNVIDTAHTTHSQVVLSLTPLTHFTCHKWTTSEDKWRQVKCVSGRVNDKWRQVKRQVKTSETTSEDKWNDKWSWHNSHVSQRQVKLVFTCRWHDEVDTTHTWVNDKWSWHNSHVSCVSCVNVVSFTMLWMLWGLHRMDIHNSHCCDWHIFRCVENRSQNNSHCCEWHNECCVTHELRVCCVTHELRVFFFEWRNTHKELCHCVLCELCEGQTPRGCVCVVWVVHTQPSGVCHSHNSHNSQWHNIHTTHTPHNVKHNSQWHNIHIWMSRVIHMDDLIRSYVWHASFVPMRHVTRTNEACHTYERIKSSMWMTRLIHIYSDTTVSCDDITITTHCCE